jgi:hypothetical protein
MLLKLKLYKSKYEKIMFFAGCANCEFRTAAILTQLFRKPYFIAMDLTQNLLKKLGPSSHPPGKLS